MTAFPLCDLHFHSVVSGKIADLKLMNDFGYAKYNVTTKLIEYPLTVPADRTPSNKAPLKQ
jgi:hypothetical protein